MNAETQILISIVILALGAATLLFYFMAISATGRETNERIKRIEAEHALDRSIEECRAALERERYPRETTIGERMTWGECPVCHAAHGEPCLAELGLHVGRNVTGQPLKTGEGVHIARLSKAPMRVVLVPAP